MTAGRAYNALSWGSAAVVVAFLGFLWAGLVYRHAAIASGEAKQVDRNATVPHDTVVILGFTAVAIGLAGVAARAWRKTAPILVRENMEALKKRKSNKPIFATLKDVALGGMSECEDFQQWAGHIGIFWGFIGLTATTTLDFFVNPKAVPLPIGHPVRILGNATGLLFMAGLTVAMARRALLTHVRAVSTFADWSFLVSLWGTGLTGFLVEGGADWSNGPATARLYLIHLIFVFAILAAAPWTKFVHAAWRPTWILFRELKSEKKT